MWFTCLEPSSGSLTSIGQSLRSSAWHSSSWPDSLCIIFQHSLNWLEAFRTADSLWFPPCRSVWNPPRLDCHQTWELTCCWGSAYVCFSPTLFSKPSHGVRLLLVSEAGSWDFVCIPLCRPLPFSVNPSQIVGWIEVGSVARSFWYDLHLI